MQPPDELQVRLIIFKWYRCKSRCTKSVMDFVSIQEIRSYLGTNHWLRPVCKNVSVSYLLLSFSKLPLEQWLKIETLMTPEDPRRNAKVFSFKYPKNNDHHFH